MGRVTRPMFKQCFATLSDVQLCPPIKFLIQSMQLMSRGRKRILGGGQGLWKQKEEKSWWWGGGGWFFAKKLPDPKNISHKSGLWKQKEVESWWWGEGGGEMRMVLKICCWWWWWWTEELSWWGGRIKIMMAWIEIALFSYDYDDDGQEDEEECGSRKRSKCGWFWWRIGHHPTIPGLGIRTASTFYLIFVFFMVHVVGICQIMCIDFGIQKHISIDFLLLIVHWF